MIRFKFFAALAAVVVIVLSTGCASITRGTTESYVVHTKPPGADVSSSSGWHCTTPCGMKVKRRSDFVLTITKPGYETVTATVTSSIDGAGAAGMAGNVLIGGIIGAGIDAGTGAMHSHKPNPLVVEMEPVGSKATLTSVAVNESSHLRLLTEKERGGCQLINTFSRGAGGRGSASANREAATSNALIDAEVAGADSYFIVDSQANSGNATVVVEALNCIGADT